MVSTLEVVNVYTLQISGQSHVESLNISTRVMNDIPLHLEDLKKNQRVIIYGSNLGTVSKRNEMKTEHLAGSCEHKRRYFFVSLANQASQVSKV
jgi:hypothetical protein